MHQMRSISALRARIHFAFIGLVLSIVAASPSSFLQAECEGLPTPATTTQEFALAADSVNSAVGIESCGRFMVAYQTQTLVAGGNTRIMTSALRLTARPRGRPTPLRRT